MAIDKVFFIGSTFHDDDKIFSIIRKTLDNVVNDKTTDIYIYDNRNYNVPVSVEDILWNFDNSTTDIGEKENKLVVVNLGYHHVNNTSDISRYFMEYHDSGYEYGSDQDPGHYGHFFCYDNKAKYKDELQYTGKYSEPAVVFMRAKDNFYIIYLLYDLFYTPSLTSCSIETFKDSLEFFAVNNSDDTIFEEKYRASAIELHSKTKNSNYRFNSVYETANKAIVSPDEISHIKKEMLSKVDIKCFIGVVNASIARISGKNYLNNELALKWLETWAENKWPIYLMFGRNLYVKQKKTIKMDTVMLNQSIKGVCHDFPQYAMTLNKFSVEEWDSNTILNQKNEILKYSYAKKGTKLTRYCSHLFNNPDLDVALSKIIQNKKIDGYIYLSIDPNDFMTCSITKHGWRSCHNCVDGEHAAGPLSYLFDNCTIVSYLTNEVIYRYNYGDKSFDWNSKYWRQLVTLGIRDNTMIFQREYPQNYVNGELTTEVRYLMEKIVSEFTNSDNNWLWNNNGARKNNVYYNADGCLHYDDIPARNTRLVKHITRKNKGIIPIKIGFSPKCPICGKNRITDTRLMTCNTCHNIKFGENNN